MIRHKKFTSSIVAAFALACSVASGAHAETFSAEIVSTELLISQATNKACPARGMLSATGTSEPLGATEVFGTDCVTVLNNGLTLQFNKGRMVLTAIDGTGTVIANYQGYFDFTKPEAPDTNLYTMRDGTFTVIGGTGRYTKATGGGSLSGFEHVNVNPAVPARGELKASGTISY